MNLAKANAEMVAIHLAVAARVAVAPMHIQRAYEITPGINERDFVRFAWTSSLPATKRPASVKTVTEIHDALLVEPIPRKAFVERVALSMSRYRLSLDENDHLARFLHLWLAVEAIAPRIADHYDIDNDEGWQGLRKLAVEEELGDDLVSRVLDVCRKVFHSLRMNTAELRESIDFIADLERLLFGAWKRLIPLEESVPSKSIAASPT